MAIIAQGTGFHDAEKLYTSFGGLLLGKACYI